jgi:Methyltransferase domain
LGLEARQETFDFAFVDGMHTFDYVFTDFFYIDKMLPVGGVIVFDDVYYPSIRKLCRYILTNLPYEAIGPDAKRAPTLRRKFVVATAARVPTFARLIRPEFDYLSGP